MPTEIEPKFIVIILVIAVAIILVALTIETYEPMIFPTPSEKTQSYTNVTKSEALPLFNDANLSVIDASDCVCTYNAGHLPRAIWCNNISGLYGTNYTFLIYGDRAEQYCIQLCGHTTGDIYYYQGTYETWIGN